MSAAAQRFDHAVVVVDALDGAIERARAAGFVVTPGGRHDALPTENALIVFADGSYLELLAMREPSARAELARAAADPARWARHLADVSAVGRRFLPRLARGDGVADAALGRAGLARFAAESRRRGFEMTGPVPMTRARGDGEALRWELLLPAADHLPFWIEDRTPRARRVSEQAAAAAHANGARGIAAVRVRAQSPAAAALAWADLFGARPRAGADGATTLEVAGVRWVLEPGSPEGACAVEIAGAAGLGDALEPLGLRAAAAG